MPLYTLWETGSRGEIVFAALHCTGGDVLIALSAVMLALFLAGKPSWPATGARQLILLTLAFGLAYTLFSEWLNIEIREAWAYRDLMPVIPLIDAGLSPVLQWIAVPLAAFWWAMQPVRHAEANSPGIGEYCRPSRRSLDTDSASFAPDRSRD